MRHQPLPGTTGADTDLVYTPGSYADMAMRLLPLYGRVLDPARGRGAFFDRIPAHCEPLWCEVAEGRNFYDWVERVDWVVTNPPWSEIRPFMAHAMTIADNVVFLVTANHAYTRARVRLAQDAGFGLRGMLHMPTPPKPWPASGFQLSLLWWQRGWRGTTETYHAMDDLAAA
ncbi:hypothetical protein [Aureimonas sp. SK2]|uniref:hypothetical protein n=1 Tax=Aureimonas sp. SK2 TaxID=3015992 RepID=UPI0024450D4C|nr:hypothetical protein [Aureimonas sp. SK2]